MQRFSYFSIEISILKITIIQYYRNTEKVNESMSILRPPRDHNWKTTKIHPISCIISTKPPVLLVAAKT